MKRILLVGLSAFALLALWQSVHRFHAENLRAAAPGGQVIWRGGKLPGEGQEIAAFTRSFPRSGRQELRLRAWSLTGGTLSLNGDRLLDLPADAVRFVRVPGGRLQDTLDFRFEAPSRDGWGAVWMAEMSGLGTDGAWICAVDGAPVPLRIWGAPPLSSFPSLGR